MSSNQERIAQFRKMATELPDDELAHFRLGSLLMEEGQFSEAADSFRRTLELSPYFSKVYQLLGQCYRTLGMDKEAFDVFTKGFEVADERGDFKPREDISKALVEMGHPAPVSKQKPAQAGGGGVEGFGGFRCKRPTCMMGARAKGMPKPPFNDDQGRLIAANVCFDCWSSWVKDYSVKVINELRLDLSRDDHQAQYDKYMMEFLGLEEATSAPLPMQPQ